MRKRGRGGSLSITALVIVATLGIGSVAAAGPFSFGSINFYAALVKFFQVWLQGQLQNNADEIVQSNHRAADVINQVRIDIFDQETAMKMKIPPEICAILDVAKQGILADRNIPNITKALEQPLLTSIIGTENPYQHVKERVERHQQQYCGEADVARGLCSEVSSTPNWDISADTLLTSRGYTNDERNAADAYIEHLINPEVPVLPSSVVEGSMQADQFRAAVMTTASRKSLALRSLGEIIGDRTRVDGMGTPIGQESASPQELLFDEMERRFGSDDWYQAITEATPGELVRRQALMKTAEIKIALRQYRQNERIEALLATTVAVLSDIAMEEHLQKLRQAAELTVNNE